MATNENVNKVIYGNQTVMDITDTTAEESDVASGEVFYKANGARSVGTLDVDSAVWGQITGDIDDQSDLQTEIAKKVIRLTQAEYNALSSDEKHDTKKVYYIYDYSPAPITLINDAVISLTSTWSSSKLSDDLDDKVDKVSGKGLSTNDFTSEEKTKLAGLQNYDDTEIRSMIPTATSQLTNNSGFITNAVNNLINYYLKSETYTKEEVNSLISTLSGIHFEYVATLPTENIQTNAIYLVPKADTQTRNVKEEYINLDGTTSGWEKIGDTDIDLSDYVTITELNTALADYVTSSAFTTALATKSTQVRLTKAQYDALTNEEKHDTTKVYYITDYTPMPVNAELNDTVTASNKVWSSQKTNQEITNNKYTLPTASSTTKGGVKVDGVAGKDGLLMNGSYIKLAKAYYAEQRATLSSPITLNPQEYANTQVNVNKSDDTTFFNRLLKGSVVGCAVYSANSNLLFSTVTRCDVTDTALYFGVIIFNQLTITETINEIRIIYNYYGWDS